MSTFRRVVPADDRMTASTAYRLARAGTSLWWQGDYHNGRQLLRALGRRASVGRPSSFAEYRRQRGERARVLSRLLVRLSSEYGLDLRRAPFVRDACLEAYRPPTGPTMVPLAELLGVIGASQWRRAGVFVPTLGARIHPHYGVFAPTRREYVDLVAQAPLPEPCGRAFDLGTGTGVLAAVLARRGVPRLAGTDASPRALACARDNVRRLGLEARIALTGPTLYPSGRADLVVCNPPWLPGEPTSDLERGVFDPGSAMLEGFLDDLPAHLNPAGEGWLILSDLAERLGLREEGEVVDRIDAAGLHVLDRLEARPRHPRAGDSADPFHATRAAEVVTLWRLEPCRRPSPGRG